MTSPIARLLGIALLMAFATPTWSQQSPPEQSPLEVPKGVEVQARGPVHEAFATPLSEPQPTAVIPRKPPAPIEELAPEERPEGDAIWIGGYWAWDDDRRDFLWVSGCWRVKPAGKEWVAGYWRETGRETAQQWQWVSGFWTTVQDDRPQNVTYFPQPPATPQVAPPPPQAADEFYVPGYWAWHGDRYVWRAGYSARVRPGYVFVASHYQWTPSGYVFIPGYWDYAIAQRGLLYAPVVIDPVVVGPTFVYTPRYAVTDTLVIDAFFVRTSHRHYYFGDYFSPAYVQLGFEPVVVYSRRCYEPIIVYSQWECRHTPRWLEVQINFYSARSAGRAPLPPRTLVQQNNIIQNNVTVNNVVNNTTVNNVTNNVTVNKTAVLAPASDVLKSRGQRTVPLDAGERSQVQKSATAQQTVAAGRKNLEQPTNVPLSQPRAAELRVPPTPPARAHGGPAAKSSPPNGVPPKLPVAELSKPAPGPNVPVAPAPAAAPIQPARPLAAGEPLKTPVVPKQAAVAPPPGPQPQPNIVPPKGPLSELNAPTPPARIPGPAPQTPTPTPLPANTAPPKQTAPVPQAPAPVPPANSSLPTAPPKLGGAPAPLSPAPAAPLLKPVEPPRPPVGPAPLPSRPVQPIAQPPALSPQPVGVPPSTVPKTPGTPPPAFAPKAPPSPPPPPPGGPPQANVPAARPAVQPPPRRPAPAPTKDPDRKKV